MDALGIETVLKRVVKKAGIHSTADILFKEAPDAPAVIFTSALAGGNDIDVIVDDTDTGLLIYITRLYTY